jgi:hypothetical protein
MKVLIGTVDACRYHAAKVLDIRPFEHLTLPADAQRMMGHRFNGDDIVVVNFDDLQPGRYLPVWTELAARMNPGELLPEPLRTIVAPRLPFDSPREYEVDGFVMGTNP